MEILQIILTAGITSGVVTAMLNWILKKRDRDEQRRWDLKREACLDALKIIDSRFADYAWKDGEGNLLEIDEEEQFSTSEIRSCFNKLVLACDGIEVPSYFEKCLNLRIGDEEPSSLSMDSVVELRDAIRSELGFGKKLHTRVNWITYINKRNI